MDANTLSDLQRRYPSAVHGEDGLTVITTVARLSFVNFEKPHTPKGSSKEPRYSCAVILPADADLTILTNAQRTAWANSRIVGTPKHVALKPQASMGKYEGFADKGAFFNCETKNPVTVIGADGKTDNSPEAAKRFYSGCWARVKVFAQAYDQAGNQGVKFWLQAVQFIADDKKLGGDASGGFGEASGAGVSKGSASGPAKAPAADAFSAGF